MSTDAPNFELCNKLLAETEYRPNLKDRYVGDVDPATKLREGSGVYTYTNAFFQYQGQWHNGKKHTDQGEVSTFVMRDGTKYAGQFLNGEITGFGVKQFNDGRVYQGEFLEGEMHGQGVLMYNPKRKGETDDTYEGQFHLNMRQGEGRLTRLNGDVFTGEFSNNHPNGHGSIHFHNGDYYTGEVVKGVMSGQGELVCSNAKCFRGQFENNQLHGDGTFYVNGGPYNLTGVFN